MAQLTVDLGGRPGADCRGFCEYCYFRHVGDVAPLGCRYCPPFRVGCDYCSRGVKEQYSGFKPLSTVADDILANLQMLPDDISRVTISGGGDPSCYPEFQDLIELLGSMEAPLHIGYTSGKGFDDPAIADVMIDNGLTEVSYTIFSANPALRKRYMHDPTPDVSLAVMRRLCEEIDVYAAAVVIPGVNDGEDLEQTCAWLDEAGAKGLILMRFANTTEQGLILGNAPLIPGQRIESVEAFGRRVTDLSERYSLKISGTPLRDPEIGSPFAILGEPDLLAKLPAVRAQASVITGSVAAPYIRRVLDACGGGCDVVPVSKEIACLITLDDLRNLDPADLEETVILPGRCFVHDRQASDLLSGDGTIRTVLRGPDMLTADAETSMGMNKNEVLQMEMEGFSALIHCINQNGRKK